MPAAGSRRRSDVQTECEAAEGVRGFCFRQRVLDGERVIWVDECNDAPNPGLTSLDGVSCSNPDQTFYVYERTGEVSTIYDAVAVATSSYGDPNHRLRYVYDTLGRVREIEDPDLEGTGKTTTGYDYAGNVLVTANARGQARTHSYDALNRLTAIVTPANEPNYLIQYQAGYRQPWRDINADYESRYAYDGFGRLAQRKLVVNGLPGTPTSRTYFTDYEYDLLGRPTRIEHPADGSVVGYEYIGGYLDRVCDLGSAAACGDSGTTDYVSSVQYDALGRRSVVSWSGGARTFNYHPANQRLSQDRFDGSGTFWYQRRYEN